MDCRHELYPSYKAQRPAPPEEFHDAGETLERVFKLMGLPMLGIPGVEADDLIGTFGTRFLKAGGFCVVVSNDKVPPPHPAPSQNGRVQRTQCADPLIVRCIGTLCSSILMAGIFRIFTLNRILGPERPPPPPPLPLPPGGGPGAGNLTLCTFHDCRSLDDTASVDECLSMDMSTRQGQMTGAEDHCT